MVISVVTSLMHKLAATSSHGCVEGGQFLRAPARRIAGCRTRRRPCLPRWRTCLAPWENPGPSHRKQAQARSPTGQESIHRRARARPWTVAQPSPAAGSPGVLARCSTGGGDAARTRRRGRLRYIAFALNRAHRVVNDLANLRRLGLGLDGVPAGFGRQPKDSRGLLAHLVCGSPKLGFEVEHGAVGWFGVSLCHDVMRKSYAGKPRLGRRIFNRQFAAGRRCQPRPSRLLSRKLPTRQPRTFVITITRWHREK